MRNRRNSEGIQIVIPIVCWGPHVKLVHGCLDSLDLKGHRVIVYTDQPKEFKHETRPLPEGKHKHERTTAAFKDALGLGPICPIAPDMVASWGLLRALESHLDKALVMVPVVRVSSWAELPNSTFSPRLLAELAIRRQHERQKLQFIEKIPCGSNPTNVFQRKGNTLTVRCFHMHPILINTTDLSKISSPIDDQMVMNFQREKIHIVTDSDEMMVVDRTDPDYDWNRLPLKKPVNTKDFVYRKCNFMHRWFFEHECYIHSDEIEKPDPDPKMQVFLEEIKNVPQRWPE